MTSPSQPPCPKCSPAPLAASFVGNVPIASCEACQGIWLSSQALRVLLEQREALEAAGRVLQLDDVFQQTSIHPCPGCRQALMTTFIAEVEVEYCPGCRGIFLDAGELEQVMMRDQTLEEFGRTDVRRHDRLVRDVASEGLLGAGVLRLTERGLDRALGALERSPKGRALLRWLK